MCVSPCKTTNHAENAQFTILQDECMAKIAQAGNPLLMLLSAFELA